MNLFVETIQEYLEEHHPNWRASSTPNAIYIDSRNQDHKYIRIDTSTETIIIYNLYMSSNTTRIAYETHYNQTTILTTISETINKAQQL